MDKKAEKTTKFDIKYNEDYSEAKITFEKKIDFESEKKKFRPLFANNFLFGTNLSLSISFTIRECKGLHNKGFKVMGTETNALALIVLSLKIS